MPAGNPLGYFAPGMLPSLPSFGNPMEQTRVPGSVGRLGIPTVLQQPMPQGETDPISMLIESALDRIIAQMSGPSTPEAAPSPSQPKPRTASPAGARRAPTRAATAATPPPALNMPQLSSNVWGDEPSMSAPSFLGADAPTPQLPQGLLEGLPADPTGFGTELDDPPPVRQSPWAGMLNGIAEGLPGALVAFAAHKAQSPEIAQQYALMKSRELESAKAKRSEEIDMMRIEAERQRHQAQLALQLFDVRTRVETNVQQLQANLSPKDPQAYVRALQSLSIAYKAAGGDPAQLLDAYPMLNGEAVAEFRKKVTAEIANTGGDPMKMGQATIINPWTNEPVSVNKAAEMLYGIDGEGRVNVPWGVFDSSQMGTETTRDAAGVQRQTVRPTGQLVGKTQVQQPAPSWESETVQDPTSGIATRTTTNRGTGAQRTDQIPTGLGEIAGVLGNTKAQVTQGQRAQVAREILFGRNGIEPTDPEVVQFLRNRVDVATIDNIIKARAAAAGAQ